MLVPITYDITFQNRAKHTEDHSRMPKVQDLSLVHWKESAYLTSLEYWQGPSAVKSSPITAQMSSKSNRYKETKQGRGKVQAKQQTGRRMQGL
jgi:hypothetical protein